ncbi:hypothetical protein SELMODRAFT_406693 [Selaginella moellendorffii]|uniref:Uncharacterized protein n=1 Tax=Selaginella moellendorffii TaxID=88036 RepID=D8R156_SELML|nr:hypothetical protein SELMODRAFT_406693 [Selaginella moellendorffii]
MDSNPCLQLRAALVRYQILLESVQAQISSQEQQSLFDCSRLDYLTRILEEKDGLEPQVATTTANLLPVEKAVRVWSSDVRCDAPGRDEDAEYLHPDESSQPPGHGALHQPDDPAKRVHIIDYGVLYGDQWPSLIKALSERAEGLPLFKITGINFPSRVNLEKTGWSTTCGMHLELHSVATVAWESAQPRYHPLDAARLRGRDHRQPRKLFFEKTLSFKPVMLFQSVVDADMGSPFFIHRFDRAWRSFLARLESFEETMKLGLIDQSQLDFMDKFIEVCAIGAMDITVWSASPRAKPGTAALEMVMSVLRELDLLNGRERCATHFLVNLLRHCHPFEACSLHPSIPDAIRVHSIQPFTRDDGHDVSCCHLLDIPASGFVSFCIKWIK